MTDPTICIRISNDRSESAPKWADKRTGLITCSAQKMNFLEQLTAEYYQHQGYYVRLNVRVLPRPNGGFDGELDVLAFEPKKKILAHIETSWDALTWSKRKARFLRKFRFSEAQYRKILGLPFKKLVKRVVTGGTLSVPQNEKWKDIEILTTPMFLREVGAYLLDKHPGRKAVPEHMPCLRSIQFYSHYVKKA